jgi:Fe-S-cluster-containing dehydrogenase component
MDRIDAGLKPACVTVCTTHCLGFGETEKMPQLKRERYARALASTKGAGHLG